MRGIFYRFRRSIATIIIVFVAYLSLLFSSWSIESSFQLLKDQNQSTKVVVITAQQATKGNIIAGAERNSSRTNDEFSFPNVTYASPKIYLPLKVSRISSYHQLWNFTTHTINIPAQDPPTSLEILQKVIQESQTILENDHCFIPDLSKTQEIMRSKKQLQLPILNVGMPKAGSSTLKKFFNCSGYNSSHDQEGVCLAKAVIRDRLQPFSGCKWTKTKQAFLQMDLNNRGHFVDGRIHMYKTLQCWWPQISFLDEIHKEYPNATFVMNFRPINDWIRSVQAHGRVPMHVRFLKCSKNIPGLISSSPVKGGVGHNDLKMFWCRHVQHIRNFVKKYPTHNLIEIDLYAKETPGLMGKLFNSSEECWGHANSRLKPPAIEKHKDS